MADPDTNWITLLGNMGSFFAGIGGLVAAGAARRSAESAAKSTESNERLVQITHADVLATHLAHFNDTLDNLRPELIKIVNTIGIESKQLQEVIISELEKTCNNKTLSTNYYSSIFKDMARQIFTKCYKEHRDNNVSYLGLDHAKKALGENEQLKISVHEVSEEELFELTKRIEVKLDSFVISLESSKIQLNGLKETISKAIEKSNHRQINIMQDPIIDTQFVLMINYINRVELLREILRNICQLGKVSEWARNKPVLYVTNIISLCSVLYLAPNEIEYQLAARDYSVR